jgi:hypothetical protein
MVATRTAGVLPRRTARPTWTIATRTRRTTTTRTARTIATRARTTAAARTTAIGARRAGAIARSLTRTTRLASAPAWTTTIAGRLRRTRDHPAGTRARHFAARRLLLIRSAIVATGAFSAPETATTTGLAAIAARTTAAAFVTTAAAGLDVGLQIDDVVELADLGRAFHFGVAGEDAHETHAIGLVTDGAERLDEPREAVTG